MTDRNKPQKLPEWATGGGANVLEPTLGEKQSGWPRSFRVPADWWNWLNLTQYEWFRRLAPQVSGALYATPLGTVGAGGLTMLKAFPDGSTTADDGTFLRRGPDSSELHHLWVAGQDDSSGSPLLFSRYGMLGPYQAHIPAAVPGGGTQAIFRDIIWDSVNERYVAAVEEVGGSGDDVVVYWGDNIDGLSNRFAISGAVAIDGEARAIAFDGTTYVVIGSEDDSAWAEVLGGPWTAVQIDDAFFEARDIKYSPTIGKWCIVGDEGSNEAIYTSNDGKVWSAVEVQSPGFANPGNPANGFSKIEIMPNGEFCIVGDNYFTGGTLTISKSGATVFERVEPWPNVVETHNVVNAGNRMLALSSVAFIGGHVVHESYDNGATWKPLGRVPAGNMPGDWRTVSGSVFLEMGGAQAGFDGENWAMRCSIIGSLGGEGGVGGYVHESFLEDDR